MQTLTDSRSTVFQHMLLDTHILHNVYVACGVPPHMQSFINMLGGGNLKFGRICQLCSAKLDCQYILECSGIYNTPELRGKVNRHEIILNIDADTYIRKHEATKLNIIIKYRSNLIKHFREHSKTLTIGDIYVYLNKDHGGFSGSIAQI